MVVSSGLPSVCGIDDRSGGCRTWDGRGIAVKMAAACSAHSSRLGSAHAARACPALDKPSFFTDRSGRIFSVSTSSGRNAGTFPIGHVWAQKKGRDLKSLTHAFRRLQSTSQCLFLSCQHLDLPPPPTNRPFYHPLHHHPATTYSPRRPGSCRASRRSDAE